MGYTYDFKDNVIYGADEINNIRKTICTAGVLPETINSCKIIKLENSLKITKGQALLNDGSRIEIDDQGFELPILSFDGNQKQYIYFYNNITENKIEPKISLIFPTGDYVLLAELNLDLTLTDKRIFTTFRMAMSAPIQIKNGHASIRDVTMNKNDVIIRSIELPVNTKKVRMFMSDYIAEIDPTNQYIYGSVLYEYNGHRSFKIYRNIHTDALAKSSSGSGIGTHFGLFVAGDRGIGIQSVEFKENQLFFTFYSVGDNEQLSCSFDWEAYL